MASVRPHPNSPYWQAVLTMEDGSRTNRSTKQTDKKKAQAVADEWQRTLDEGRQGKLVEGQILKTYNEILERVGCRKINDETVEAYLRRWVKGKHNEGTQERYGRAVDLFLKFLDKKAANLLSSVTHKDILGYIENRQKQSAAPKTIEIEVKSLRGAFNIATKLSLISENPIQMALTLTPIFVEQSEKARFTDSQVQKMLAVAEGDWKTMVLLGYYTGARIGDCANMRWSHIKEQDGISFLHFVQKKPKSGGKTPKLVPVPIHPCLKEHFDSMPNFNSDAPLCPSLAGKGSGGAHGLSAGFTKVMIAAGIDPKKSMGKGTREFSELSFHSFRHTITSNLADRGISAEVRKVLTGHSSDAVHAGYTHHDLSKLSSAMATLPIFKVA